MNKEANPKAIILGGGFGTRLNGAVDGPKGLIEVGGATLFGRMIDDLRQTPDISETALVANARYYDQYKLYLEEHYPDFSIILVNDGAFTPEEKKGALGDLMFSLDELDWWQNDILVLPTDTYYSFKIARLRKFFSEQQSFVTVVREFEDKSKIKNKLGCAVMKGEQVVGFIEKPEDPPSCFAAIPFYIYPKEILPILKQYSNEGGNMDAPGSIIPWLIEKGIKVYALNVTGLTIDVGTPDDLKRLQNL